MRKGLNRTLSVAECLSEGAVTIPFSFVINGTSDPDGVKGPLTWVRSAAGKFTGTLLDDAVPAQCFYGRAGVSQVADSVDMLGQVDWSSVVSAGTVVVRTMAGATMTDPTDNYLVGGVLFVRKIDR